MKRSLFSFCFLLFLSSIFSTDLNKKDLYRKYFEEGNKNYLKGNYEIAVENYLKAYDLNKNFDITYNLSLTYFKMNKLGYSKYYAEKAMFIKPFNKEINILLNKLSEIVSDDYTEITFLYRFFFFLKPGILFIFFLILYSGIIFINFSKIKHNKKVFIVLFSIMIIFITTIIISQKIIISKKYGFVTKNTNIYLTNSEETIINSINDGNKVLILDMEDNFYYIKFNSNIYGWIKKDSIIK